MNAKFCNSLCLAYIMFKKTAVMNKLGLRITEHSFLNPIPQSTSILLILWPSYKWCKIIIKFNKVLKTYEIIPFEEQTSGFLKYSLGYSPKPYIMSDTKRIITYYAEPSKYLTLLIWVSFIPKHMAVLRWDQINCRPFLLRRL